MNSLTPLPIKQVDLQPKASASLQTSWQQKDPRLPHFCALPVRQDARVNPCVLLRHVDDVQHKRRLGLPFKYESCSVHAVPVVGNVSVVQPAQELHLAGSEDGAEPVDGVALDVPAVAGDGAVVEELGVKSCQLFLRQNEVRICGNKETFPKGH